MKTETVDVSNLKIGDTVLVKGEMKTVSRDNFKKDPFMGYSFYGTNARIWKSIERVLFETWRCGISIGFKTQP